jgi:hypothetical protein
MMESCIKRIPNLFYPVFQWSSYNLRGAFMV